MRTNQMQLGLLHRHPRKENLLGLNPTHVVVDHTDWRLVCDYIAKLPLSADKVVLWPGDTVLRAGVGQVYVYTVTTVGLDGYIQVTHADGSGGEWALMAAELYGRVDNATRAADENQAHFDARKAALHLGGQATLGDVTRAEADQDAERTGTEAWCRSRRSETLGASLRLSDFPEVLAITDDTREALEAAEAREAVAAYRAAIKAMSERQVKREPAIWPIDFAESIHADREAEAIQADQEAQDAGQAAQVYAWRVGRGLCQGWAGEEAPWDR
jgi:hypothetical protein